MCKAEGQQTDVSLGGARVVTAGVKPVPALTLHQLPGAQAGWDQFLQLHIGILRSLKQKVLRKEFTGSPWSPEHGFMCQGFPQVSGSQL